MIKDTTFSANHDLSAETSAAWSGCPVAGSIGPGSAMSCGGGFTGRAAGVRVGPTGYLLPGPAVEREEPLSVGPGSKS